MWIKNETYDLDNFSYTTETTQTTMYVNSIINEKNENFLKTRFFISVCLLCLGLFGNYFIFLVLKGVQSLTSILAIYMAVFDTLSLLSKVYSYGLEYYKTYNYGYFYCVTWYIPTIIFGSTTNWTLVLICIERFISIFFPFHHRSFVSTRRVHVTMATVLCIFVVYSVVLNFMTIAYSDSPKQCVLMNVSSSKFNTIINCVAFAGPSLLITTFTLLVIFKLKFSKRNFGREQKSNSRQQLESSLSRLMLSSAILFMILTLPGTLYYCLISPALDSRKDDPVIDIVLFLLSDVSNILNFVVYLIFVKAFRSKFLQIIARK
ncbi:probable G-protein coupled receptor B0563.6 [Biomphalaria glabrata]|uniref:Probable G-protein coupled receptor B0563.6 n=1 Tax=Biomphalaria glabrata TaxID=6526 RepID=A0A9U8EFI9_BIOGL|nr:probable G-protein coupled receptor B0563.6 [Biomphalaria glabrata]